MTLTYIIMKADNNMMAPYRYLYYSSKNVFLACKSSDQKRVKARPPVWKDTQKITQY